MKAKFFETNNAPQLLLSHQELLALQLGGIDDKKIIYSAEKGQTEKLKGELTNSLLSKAYRLLEKQRILGIQTVSFLELASYPRKLNDLGEERPVLLHYQGAWGLLQNKMVAIIGSRRASHVGALMAEDLGILYGGIKEDRNKWYAEAGCPDFVKFPYSKNSPYVIVSGLAHGCDSRAHQGCLSIDGKTIAVVATGLDSVYPLENNALQIEILEKGGLVVSEQVIGEKASGKLRARNRIIAALADIVLVSECCKQSGTMHAVGYAHKLNRKILAVEYGVVTDYNDGNAYLLEEGIARPICYPF